MMMMMIGVEIQDHGASQASPRVARRKLERDAEVVGQRGELE